MGLALLLQVFSVGFSSPAQEMLSFLSASPRSQSAGTDTHLPQVKLNRLIASNMWNLIMFKTNMPRNPPCLWGKEKTRRFEQAVSYVRSQVFSSVLALAIL